MKLLRLLSGLAAWAFGRRPPVAQSWYQSTSFGERCDSNTHCKDCRPNGDCDLCDTIDGRHMDAVAEYAQTCDGCGDLTMNESLVADRARLAYCRKCEDRRKYRHGWYSAENDKALGHYYCTLAAGGTVMVTNVTNSPTGGLAGWPDAVYVGEVVPNPDGIRRERYGKPWTPPWSEDAKCKDGTCDHKDGPCADRKQANLIRRFQAATRTR